MHYHIGAYDAYKKRRWPIQNCLALAPQKSLRVSQTSVRILWRIYISPSLAGSHCRLFATPSEMATKEDSLTEYIFFQLRARTHLTSPSAYHFSRLLWFPTRHHSMNHTDYLPILRKYSPDQHCHPILLKYSKNRHPSPTSNPLSSRCSSLCLRDQISEPKYSK